MAAVFAYQEVCMSSILKQLNRIDFDIQRFAIGGLILLAGFLVIGLIARFVFGKKSMLNHSVSSAVAIIFIYGVLLVLKCCGLGLGNFSAPLPFMEAKGNCFQLIPLGDLHFTMLCSQLLSMVVLAFLVNLAETVLSHGKGFFSWLAFRVLTVVIGYGLHILVVYLSLRFLPGDIMAYAPVIILGMILLLLATGILKLLIGGLISAINPIIGGLYTFFFANIIGKMITKAILTTALLAGFVMALSASGITTIAIGLGALFVYIPFLLVLVVLWYLVNKIL